MGLVAVLAGSTPSTAAGAPVAADCERLSGGLLAQPVNALSSLAYVAAGAALAVPALRTGAPRRAERIAFAVTVAADGVGSILFHGARSFGGQAVHDASLAATLLFLGTYDLAVVRGWSGQRTVTLFAAGAAAIGALVAAQPGLTNVTVAVLGAGCIAAEAAVIRAGARPVPLALIALVCGTALDFAGGTGGPLCRPDSLLQGHAGWHVLTALALWAWGNRRLMSPAPGAVGMGRDPR